MTVTLEREPETAPQRPERSSTRPERSSAGAWVAIALAPVGIVLAVLTMFGIADIVGVDLWSSEPLGTTAAVEILGPTMLVGFAAPVFGVVLGVRSATTGNRAGAVAAAVATLILVPLAVWWIATAVQV